VTGTVGVRLAMHNWRRKRQFNLADAPDRFMRQNPAPSAVALAARAASAEDELSPLPPSRLSSVRTASGPEVAGSRSVHSPRVVSDSLQSTGGKWSGRMAIATILGTHNCLLVSVASFKLSDVC